MGLYLSEINMPKGEGSKLVLQIFPNGEVYDGHGIRLGITKLAEAIPVPPHGRLIDTDKLNYEQTVEALKKYNNNIEEETTMHKTQNEIEFENFANERRAQADASVQAYKDKVENEIETKRQECLEADKKERAYQAAAQYRYFFDFR